MHLLINHRHLRNHIVNSNLHIADLILINICFPDHLDRTLEVKVTFILVKVEEFANATDVIHENGADVNTLVHFLISKIINIQILKIFTYKYLHYIF